eukprot:TRINITY_DN5226_c0_g2_i1.p1 TRINITY_DN5226_c0_g2~~TRINITY_DN5226_c0_g2_i1.p1  ORF type:complete len:667 (-),score=153.52 TRINITY_DN5226_c0_g2_i1:204-2129(-)
MLPCKCKDITGYANTVRLRVAYFGVITAVTIASLILGGSLQLFFAILGSDSELMTTWERCVVVFLAPGLFFVGAILTDECIDLVLDAIGDPPLDNFRAALAVAIGQRTTKMTDYAMVIAFEGIPLVFGIALCIKHSLFTASEFLTSYIAGAVVWMTLSSFLQLLSLLLIWSSEAKREAYVVMLKNMAISDFLDEIADSDEESESEEKPVEQSLSKPLSAQAKLNVGAKLRGVAKKNQMKFDAHGKQNPKLAGLIILGTLVVLTIAALFLSEYSALCIVILGLSLLALSAATHFLIPVLLGPTYYIMLVLFVVLAFSLTTLKQSHAMDATDSEAMTQMTLVPPSVAGYNAQSYDDVYPVCTMRWAGEGVTDDAQKLNAIDLASFAEAVYHMDNVSVKSMLSSFTAGTALEGATLEYLQDQRTVGRWGIFSLPMSKVDVFAVRGTTTGDDAMADADMFATIKIMQFADSFVSVLRIIPPKLIRELVGAIVLRKFFKKDPIFAQVVRAAEEAKAAADAKGHELVVTGHSLGGILAAIVGAKTSSQTVAISPPGEYYSIYRFNIPQMLFERNVVTIQPNKDIVPEVDRQVGMVQKISCAAPAISCHSIVRTICELVRSCGDPRKRGYSPDSDVCKSVLEGGQPDN